MLSFSSLWQVKSWIEKFKVEAMTGPIAYMNHFTIKVSELIKLK